MPLPNLAILTGDEAKQRTSGAFLRIFSNAWSSADPAAAPKCSRSGSAASWRFPKSGRSTLARPEAVRSDAQTPSLASYFPVKK